MVDVLPTMLAGVGISVPQEVQGESLLNMMKSASAERQDLDRQPKEHQDSQLADRPIYAESDYPLPRIDGVRCGRYEREVSVRGGAAAGVV